MISGNSVAEKIAQRLGRYRCEEFYLMGKKIANGDLKNGIFKKAIYNYKEISSFRAHEW